MDPMAEKYYSMSPYGYAGNNPLKYTDPTGEYIESIWDLASLAMGAKSFIDNVRAGNVGAAIVDGVGILADGVALALPIVPGGAGAAIKGVRAADKVVNAEKVMDKVATARGLENEAKVLKEMDVPKNNKTFQTIDPKTGKQVSVKPDGIDNSKVVEVKDTKTISNTKQIRGEREVAKNQGKDFKIVTGTETKVSKNIPQEEIIRRTDLGPQ